jgi:NRPS condensation-like uncharacterized protein
MNVKTAVREPEFLPTVMADRLLLVYQDVGLLELTIQLELEFAGQLDRARLQTAFDLLLDAEPVLGCRLRRDTPQLRWQRLAPTERQSLQFLASWAEYEQFKIQTMDPCCGQQLHAGLYAAATGDWLLLRIAHTVADAGGLKEVARRLTEIYRGLAHNPDYQPASNWSGRRDGGQIMDHIPWHAYPRILWNYFRQTLASTMPLPTHSISVGQGPWQPYGYVVRDLEPVLVRQLKSYAKAQAVTINDLIVTAFFRTQVRLGQWDGRKALRLQTTVNLRRWYLPTQRAEGICNLSAYEYPQLGRELGQDFAATLERVAAYMKRRKSSWPGLTEVCLLPIFRRLAYPSLLKCFRFLCNQVSASGMFPNTLTNMGPIERSEVNFGDLWPAKARLIVPCIAPPFLGVGISGYQDMITLSAGVANFARPQVETFFAAIVEELATLAPTNVAGVDVPVLSNERSSP